MNYTKIKGVEGPGIPRTPEEDKKLPTEVVIEGSPGQAQMPALPSLSESDPLTLLQGLMSEIAPIAQRKARAKGMEEMFKFTGERGITPSDLPGSTVNNMIRVMDRAMSDPVVDRMTQMNNMLTTIQQTREDNRATATTQIESLMNTDVWNKMITQNPEDVSKLWKSAGFIGEPYAIPKKTDWRFFTDDNGGILAVDKNDPNNTMMVAEGGRDRDGIEDNNGTFDLGDYFSPSELREIRISGIDPNTKKGFEAAQKMFPPERDKWNSADAYIDENIKQGATSPSDMAEIFSNLTRPAPDGAGLNPTEAKTLMAESGMIHDLAVWIYLPQ